MPRGGIKIREVRSTVENKDVMDMFKGMIGADEETDLDLKIVYKKYIAVRTHSDRFIRLLEALRDSSLMEKLPEPRDRLAEYCASLRDEHLTAFAAPNLAVLHPPTPLGVLAGHVLDLESVTREEYDAFAAVYHRLKGCGLVNTIIVTCQNLIVHKRSLENLDALQSRFLTRTAGMTFAPLPGLGALNFKQIYIDDVLGDGDRQFLMMVLHKMYTISHDLYEAMSSPDVDVDDFVRVIMSSLDTIRKRIPRCEQAFDKIRDSVHLLKANFGGYHKDYVASGNPTIIMENFVLDVSQGTKSSPKVAGQFRRIISHYRRAAEQRGHDPKLAALFQQVDKNMAALERRGRDADAASEDESEDVSEDDSADGPASAGEEVRAPAEIAGGDSAESASDEPDAAAERRAGKNRKRRERAKRKKAEHRLETDEGLAEEFARGTDAA